MNTVIGGAENTARMPTVIGRVEGVFQDAGGDRRSSTGPGVVAHVVVPLLGLILAAALPPAPALAAAYSATGSVWQDFNSPGSSGTPTVSPTGATFLEQYQAQDINLLSRAEASQGNIHLFTLASINGMTRWESGHVSADATATIIEPLYPNWQFLAGALPGYGNIVSFTFDYEIWVAGNLYTTSAGPGAAGSEAGLSYSYRIGDSSGAGRWEQNSAGQTSQSGTWNGSIIGSFTVQKDAVLDLALRADAGGSGTKTYVPGSNTTVVAMADFSHTMSWKGITGMRAFDSLGNEVALPPDIYLPLTGRDSGFDYWHAAPVPLPPALWLIGTGLVGLLPCTKRRSRRIPPG